LYAATDAQIEKLAAALDVDSDQAAKNLLQVRDMIVSMEKKAPPQAYQTLANFKDASWNALNSYVHAGIHPLQRRTEGYPIQLVEQMLKNSNGLALIAGMQTAVLTGNQQVVRRIGALQESHHSCLPSR